MGAPKQKWTSEEEAALKAGIRKYGIGKWSTILKDPEFNPILRSRSNVDLKDKYRNLNCLVLGSRHRAKPSNRSNALTIKKDVSASVRDVIVEKDSKLFEGASLAESCEISQGEGSRKSITREVDVILEAITKLKEPRGSSRPSIAQYITVKNQYRIAPRSLSFSLVKEPLPLENGPATRNPLDAQKTEFVLLTKAMIDAELEKMKSMSPEDAAKAAAKAVAEAEAAIAEAEAAAREAEEAEAEAEAARCFAAAAQRALNFQTLHI